ncbi:hypothetical protein [Halorubellus litoreus]|uniref:C1q domain-containing protein n=1 Tax=Halorubellus litoreus TaxID=755308 RepID=A0ABD5VEM6_9EURY
MSDSGANVDDSTETHGGGRIEALEAENERLRERLESLEETLEAVVSEESDAPVDSGLGPDSKPASPTAPDSDESASGTTSRRGVMTGLASLGLLGLGSSAASASGAASGDHVGETWSGDPSADQLLRLDATGSTNAGLYATSESDSGKGMVAKAKGPNYTKGVLGLVASDKGTGVKGNAFSSSGNTEGVFGLAKSTSGTGVKGKASADSGFTKGIQGLAKSPDGRGVQGVAYSTSGESIGVRGESKSTTSHAAGVKGHATGSSGETHGVEGEVDSYEGSGVVGAATKDGFSYPDLTGTPIGVFGVSDWSGDDSNVSSGVGMFGWASASTGATVGMVGRSDSPDGVGVRGIDGQGDGFAVESLGDSLTTGSHTVQGPVSRECTTVVYLSSDQTVPDGSETRIQFDTTAKDEFSAWDANNYQYVVPFAGDYRVDLALKYTLALPADSRHNTYLRSKSNGTKLSLIRDTPSNGGNMFVHDTGSALLPDLSKGETLYLSVNQKSGSQADIQAGQDTSFLSITHVG